MTEPEKQARAIYGTICATSGDRPLSFHTVAQLVRETSNWKARNPALTALRNSSPAVQLAFLKQSFEWLRAETQVDRNIRVCQTLPEAIQIALELSPRPLPPELTLKLLSEFRQEFSMARFYFPFVQFLALLTRDQ